jgi:hypothetical protein
VTEVSHEDTDSSVPHDNNKRGPVTKSEIRELYSSMLVQHHKINELDRDIQHLQNNFSYHRRQSKAPARRLSIVHGRDEAGKLISPLSNDINNKETHPKDKISVDVVYEIFDKDERFHRLGPKRKAAAVAKVVFNQRPSSMQSYTTGNMHSTPTLVANIWISKVEG